MQLCNFNEFYSSDIWGLFGAIRAWHNFCNLKTFLIPKTLFIPYH